MTPSTPAGSSGRASSWSGDGGILQVVDLQAAEHTWEVSPGTALHGYGFNRQVPGPVIEATVGDRLLVQFSNDMDQTSALVWESPSVGAVPLNTSAPHWVLPGGSQQSEVALTEAGAFLYRAISQSHTANTMGGLYGVLLVRGPGEAPDDEERILVVHNAEVNAIDQDEAPPPAPAVGRPDPLLLLINGVRHAAIDMSAGSREHWRILNAAEDVQLRLSLPPRPARRAAGDACRRSCSDLLVPPASTLSASGLDVQIGPFTRGQRISLDAVFAENGSARQDWQLISCQVI